MKLTCQQCAKEFERPHRRATRGRRRGVKPFCSPTCVGEFSKKPWWHRMAVSARSGARKRTRLDGMIHDLTPAELKAVLDGQKWKCAVSSVTLDPDNQNPLLRPSIDRIDSNSGYTKTNVQVVCLAYNYMKLTYTDGQARNALTTMIRSATFTA